MQLGTITDGDFDQNRRPSEPEISSETELGHQLDRLCLENEEREAGMMEREARLPSGINLP